MADFDPMTVKSVTMPRLDQLYSATSKATLAKQRVLSAHLLKNSAKLKYLRAQAPDYVLDVMDSQKAQCVTLQMIPTDRQGNGPDDRMNRLLKGRQAGKQVVHSPNSWLSVFDSGSNNNQFGMEEWRVWFCQATGANNPQVSENIRNNKRTCRGCE